ncbi:unnamed protein product, partial [Brachionus calyciflorus]
STPTSPTTTISSTLSTSTPTSPTKITFAISTQRSTLNVFNSTLLAYLETSNIMSSNLNSYSFFQTTPENLIFKIDEKNIQQINEFLLLKVDLTDCVGCHVDTRPCSSNPCRNNGTCINNLINKTYNCECFDHLFYGINCELKKNVCENETCSNNGVCYDYHNEPKCKCNSLYNGTKCEILSDELILIKSVIKTSSIIAIAILLLSYVTIALNDISNLFLKQSPKNKKEVKKTQNLPAIHLQYIE